MSLDVPTPVLDAAARGDLDDAQIVAVVRDSLPYAWQVIGAAAAGLNTGAAINADLIAEDTADAVAAYRTQRVQQVRA